LAKINLLQYLFNTYYFDKLFSLVVHYETVYLFLAVAIFEDWDLYIVDVKTAYLHGAA